MVEHARIPVNASTTNIITPEKYLDGGLRTPFLIIVGLIMREIDSTH
jgi:hypothetical protein